MLVCYKHLTSWSSSSTGEESHLRLRDAYRTNKKIQEECRHTENMRIYRMLAMLLWEKKRIVILAKKKVYSNEMDNDIVFIISFSVCICLLLFSLSWTEQRGHFKEQEGYLNHALACVDQSKVEGTDLYPMYRRNEGHFLGRPFLPILCFSALLELVQFNSFTACRLFFHLHILFPLLSSSLLP